MNKKFLSISFAAMLTAVAVQSASASTGPQVSPAATTPPKKVTICHRTHSVTNPYVRITVSESSISPNAANKHGGQKHDTWSNVLFASKPVPNVFNPAVTYTPAPEKKWGDIVPNKYVDNTAFNADGNGNGINYTGIGLSIYNGTAPYTGICKSMNARDFYEVEKANGIDPALILEDLDETKDAEEFASALTACGGSFANCTDPSKLGTMSIAAETTTTVAATTTTVAVAATTTVVGSTATTVAGSTATTVAGSTATTVAGTKTVATLPAGVTLAAGKGAISVTIWVDENRDGIRDTDEKNLKGMSVTVKGPNGVTKTAKTDANGIVSFVDLDPGEWSIVSVLSVDGYEKVYDSDGSVNWKTNLTVTAGSVAAASFAAATVEVADDAAATLTATGAAQTMPLTALALVMLAVGVVLVTRRRRTA